MTLPPDFVSQIHHLRQVMEASFPDFQTDLAWMVGHDRGWAYKAGVDAAVEWMRARLAALGCELQLFESESTGNTLAGTLRGAGRGRYLLIAHLDTVWPEGTAAQWPLVIDGRRASGPGVVDNGSGSLAGYYILKTLQQAGCANFELVTLLCNGDEESGSVFSGDLIRQMAIGYDAAFCLEAPSAPDEMISRRAGSMVYDLRVTGRRAHSQVEPEKGCNAILELCHKVIEAHKIVGDDDVLLISVATVEGGPASGSVPDTARAELDVRFKSMDDVPRIDARFQAIAARAWVPGVTATAVGKVYHPPMESLPGTPRLVELTQAISRELGAELKDTYCGGVSDGSFATVVGVPTLCGLAPYGADYHTHGEWLDLGTVVARVTVVAGLIAALA